MQPRGLSKRHTPKRADRREKENQIVSSKREIFTPRSMQNRKQLLQNIKPLELSSLNAQDSSNPASTLMRTPSLSSFPQLSNRIPQETEPVNHDIEPLASAVEHLFKNQNKFGVLISDLIHNFNDFFQEIQRNSQQDSKENRTSNDKTKKSNLWFTEMLNENAAQDICRKVEKSFSVILSQIEIISKETNTKLQQYETFLKNFAKKQDALYAMSYAIQKKEGVQSKSEFAMSSPTNRAPNFLTDYLQSPIDQRLQTQSERIINKMFAAENSTEAIEELGDCSQKEKL